MTDPALAEHALRFTSCSFHRARIGSPCGLYTTGKGWVCDERIKQSQHAKAPAAEGVEQMSKDAER